MQSTNSSSKSLTERRPTARVGPLERLQRAVDKVSQSNAELAIRLHSGQQLIENHMAANILEQVSLERELARFNDQVSKLNSERDEKMRELEHIFLRCQELSKQNVVELQKSQDKEKEIAELQKQLERQDARFRSLLRVIGTSHDRQAEAMQLKFRTRESSIQSRLKLIRQHEHIWELEDAIEQLEVERASLHEDMKRQVRLPAIGQSPSRQMKCQRDDCAMFRQRLADVLRQLKQLVPGFDELTVTGEFQSVGALQETQLESILDTLTRLDARTRHQPVTVVKKRRSSSIRKSSV